MQLLRRVVREAFFKNEFANRSQNIVKMGGICESFANYVAFYGSLRPLDKHFDRLSVPLGDLNKVSELAKRESAEPQGPLWTPLRMTCPQTPDA